MTKRKTLKRGANRKADSVFVGAWLPVALVAAMDRAVMMTDSDRSKIIRSALAEKIKIGAA